MEKLEKIHIYICVLAAAVMTGLCLYKRMSLYQMSIWVSVTIIIFYVLGLAIRFYLLTAFQKSKASEEEESNPDSSEDAMRDEADGLDESTYGDDFQADSRDDYGEDDITR